MTPTGRYLLAVPVALLLCAAGLLFTLLYESNRYPGRQLPTVVPMSASTPYAGSNIVPPHRLISPLKNERWQPMPREVIGVFVAPYHRIWTQLRSNEPLTKPAFKTMVEREYALPDPQFSGGLLLLGEPPAAGAPHGRIWFELIHQPARGTGWCDSSDKPWATLLGYAGVPGSWIERNAAEGWEPGNEQGFSWWNTCITRDERRRYCFALAGCEFFVHGGDIECFDGCNWTSKTIGRGPDNTDLVQLMPEPDGKGIVVLHTKEPPTPTVDNPQIIPEHLWRWRHGNWKDVTLPEPEEWHIRDSRPTMGIGGMWICSRDGLWLSPFDGTAHPVASRVLGEFQWFSDGDFGARLDGDEYGRICLRHPVIWSAKQPQPPPPVKALLDESERLRSDPRVPYSAQALVWSEIASARAGGIIVREPDGSCRFFPGDPDQPFGLQAQLPDQHFTIVDTDGQAAYAAWSIGPANSPDPPIMAFRPDSPASLDRLDHSPNLNLQIRSADIATSRPATQP